MKETRYFYSPNASDGVLPPEEAIHAVRVLRLTSGDFIHVIDGKGNIYLCTLVQANPSSCTYRIKSSEHIAPQWPYPTQIAIAPTKNIDRIEWFAEKATEIGIDKITFLNCQYSERKIIKLPRIEKIIISASKQSHKMYIPEVEEMIDFNKFIHTPFEGVRCIAHCYDEKELLTPEGTKPFLLHVLNNKKQPMQVLIGPEGDFSTTEVKEAIQQGFIPISLGPSRLRTETAAIVAAHLMQLAQQKN